jgi:cell division protein ZapE
MHYSPILRYRRLIEECQLSPDVTQEAAMGRLQALFEALTSEDRFSAEEASLFARLKRRMGSNDVSPASTQGIYMWGGVGRGKSMLMDMFAHALPFAEKQRIHFHTFMQEMHAELKRLREAKAEDPLLHMAEGLAARYRVLCFDELHIPDITDALFLSRVFEVLFARGVVVVFTSNRPPEALYHGIHRERLAPFIALIRNHMQVVELTSPRDYRQQRAAALTQRYFTPDDENAQAAFAASFAQMTLHQLPMSETLHVQGHHFTVDKSCGDVGWTDFATLCVSPLGAADYTALAKRFRVLFIDGVPQMDAQHRNEAKRFVTLIDILYEHHTLLCVIAETEPEMLYPAGDGSFEFARTASRLREMMAEDY